MLTQANDWKWIQTNKALPLRDKTKPFRWPSFCHREAAAYGLRAVWGTQKLCYFQPSHSLTSKQSSRQSQHLFVARVVDLIRIPARLDSFAIYLYVLALTFVRGSQECPKCHRAKEASSRVAWERRGEGVLTALVERNGEGSRLLQISQRRRVRQHGASCRCFWGKVTEEEEEAERFTDPLPPLMTPALTVR